MQERESKPRSFPTPNPSSLGGEQEEEEESGEYVDEEQYRRLEALSQAERLDADQLTEEEHMAFRRALLSGELGKMVEVSGSNGVNLVSVVVAVKIKCRRSAHVPTYQPYPLDVIFELIESHHSFHLSFRCGSHGGCP